MGCTQVAFGRPVATSRLKSAAVYFEWLAQKETCDYDRRQRLLEVARFYRSLAGIIPDIPTQYKIKVGPSVTSAERWRAKGWDSLGIGGHPGVLLSRLECPKQDSSLPAVSPAYPSKKPTRPLLTKDARRVLELLAGSARQGCTEAFLLAHGFTVELLGSIVRAGFATAHSERVRAGGQPIEVTRVHITDAGRRALRGKQG